MRGEDLTRDQLERLARQVRRQHRYLNRLVARMEHLRFAADDMIFREALLAQAAHQGLAMAIHYAHCSGVGKAPAAAHASPFT